MKPLKAPEESVSPTGHPPYPARSTPPRRYRIPPLTGTGQGGAILLITLVLALESCMPSPSSITLPPVDSAPAPVDSARDSARDSAPTSSSQVRALVILRVEYYEWGTSEVVDWSGPIPEGVDVELVGQLGTYRIEWLDVDATPVLVNEGSELPFSGSGRGVQDFFVWDGTLRTTVGAARMLLTLQIVLVAP